MIKASKISIARNDIKYHLECLSFSRIELNSIVIRSSMDH